MSEDIKKPVVLRVYKDGELQTIKQFTLPQIVIGQSSEVQLPLNHKSVSVIHAAIEQRDSGFYVCDLGSESGTKLNGNTVLDSKLNSGDEINIGEFKIEFFVGVPKPKTPPGLETPAATATPPLTKNAVKPPASVTASEPPKVAKTPPVSTNKNVETKKPEAKAPEVKAPETKAPEAKALPKTSESVASSPPIIPSGPPLQLKPVVITAASASAHSTSGERHQATSSGGHSGLETYARQPKSKSHKKRKAFAPESKFKKVDEFVKPSRGTVVEVLVAWRERIINTYHFSQQGTFTFGSHPEADIQIPLSFSRQLKAPLLKIDSTLTVLLSDDMAGEMIRQGQNLSFSDLQKQNRMVRFGNMFNLALDQGEMLKIELGELSIILRYVSEAPKPLIAPFLDLTASESVGVIFAVVLVAILAIYNYLYTPPRPLEADALQEDPAREAKIIVKPRPKEVVELKPEPTPESTPPPAKSTPTKKAAENSVKAKKESIADESKKKDPGKAAEAAPNKVKTPAKIVGVKKGGSVKTTDSAASQIQSKPKKDLTKSGVFSVFGGGGKNNELAKETAGAGELAGLSNQATGKSGMNENRSGEGLGTIYDTGRGGNGTAAVGRPDVKGGNGRGTGNSGYGSGGVGGGRQGVKIQPGGSEESFSGSIDREAIRRVIQANLKAIRACYEKQLNRRPDLFGKLVIEWDIGDAGRVMRAHVKSSELSDPEVGSCVVMHLKTWTFPSPPTNNEVTVSFPFFFSN